MAVAFSFTLGEARLIESLLVERRLRDTTATSGVAMSGLASILTATTPLFTVIAAHFLTASERLTWGKVVGVVRCRPRRLDWRRRVLTGGPDIWICGDLWPKV